MDAEPRTLKCDECGAEVAPPNGGVGVLCLKPVCAKHMAPPKGDVGSLGTASGGGAG